MEKAVEEERVLRNCTYLKEIYERIEHFQVLHYICSSVPLKEKMLNNITQKRC